MKKDKFIKPFLVWDFTISIAIWALINWQGLLSFTFTFSSAESWILFFWILFGLIIFFTFFALIFNIKKFNIFLKFTKVWFLVFYFIFSAVLMSILAAGFIKGEVIEEKSINQGEVIDDVEFKKWKEFEFEVK